jgi:hypothetical protein
MSRIVAWMIAARIASGGGRRATVAMLAPQYSCTGRP